MQILLKALAALPSQWQGRDRACGLNRRVGLRNAETGVQCHVQFAQQIPAVIDTAPEGLAEQPASSSATKWYLNSQLTGLERVPAQQKGSGAGSSACQESSERRGSRVALPTWRGIFPSRAWEVLHISPSRSGGRRICWAKLPHGTSPAVSCIRTASPARVVLGWTR